MANISQTLDRIAPQVARIRDATLAQIRDSRSRLAGIRDPALHYIMGMVQPRPIGTTPDRKCNIVYEYCGKYYVQYYDSDLQPVGVQYFVKDVVAARSTICGWFDGGYYKCVDRVIYMIPNIKTNPPVILGKLPDGVLAIHIGADGHIADHTWTAIDYNCKLRSFSRNELVLCD